MTGIQNRISGHCNTLLSVAGMNTDYITGSGSQEILLSWKNRGSMPVVSRSKQYNVKLRPAQSVWQLLFHQFGVTNRLFHRLSFATDAEYVFIRNGGYPKKEITHHSIITVRVFGRHTTFVHPIDFHTVPRSDIQIFIRP